MQFDKVKAEEYVRAMVFNKVRNLNDFSNGWDQRVIAVLSPNTLNTAHVHRFDLKKMVVEERTKLENVPK